MFFIDRKQAMNAKPNDGMEPTRNKPRAAHAGRCYDFRCQEWAATFFRSS
jgi:hypothetical protein